MPINYPGLCGASEIMDGFFSLFLFTNFDDVVIFLWRWKREESGIIKPGGPVPGYSPSGCCCPHSIRLNSLHTPFILISDCCVSSWASWHLWPGIRVSPTPGSQGLSTEFLLLAPSAECPEREEQRLCSSRRGSGRVNTGQMLQSLFRDPVY